MQKLFVVVVGCVLAICCGSAFSKVELRDRRFFVNDIAHFAKGVGYAPVPVGSDPTVSPPYGDYFTENYASIWTRDLPNLRALGANTIRLWGWNNQANHTAFLNACYNNGTNPIYVAAEFWMGPSSYPNLAQPAVQQQVQTDFQTFLISINAHPAILAYVIGSDLNAPWNYASELNALFTLINKLALAAHVFDPSHPVTTALNDYNSISTITAYDAVVVNLDFWSLNVYRGCTFGPLFTDFAAASQKGLLLTEYGIDSYDDLVFSEDDVEQAICIVSLWGQILGNSSVTLGGAVVEYVDEYWKGKLGDNDDRHPDCPNYNPSVHSNCGNANANFPDGYANQAWFGLWNASFVPRQVYTSLQKAWNATAIKL